MQCASSIVLSARKVTFSGNPGCPSLGGMTMDWPTSLGKYASAFLRPSSKFRVNCTTVLTLLRHAAEYGGLTIGCIKAHRKVCTERLTGACVAIHHFPPCCSRTQLAFKYLPCNSFSTPR